jgi:hypothetical protein
MRQRFRLAMVAFLWLILSTSGGLAAEVLEGADRNLTK